MRATPRTKKANANRLGHRQGGYPFGPKSRKQAPVPSALVPEHRSRTERAEPKPVTAGTFTEFMARACSMELEASERYANFAERLETRSYPEVALLFRRLAEIEGLHAKRIITEMRWSSPPALSRMFAWKGSEGPETAPIDSLCDRIEPPEALAIALGCERQAQRYFENIALSTAPESVRAVAAQMASEEKEHARMIEIWLAKMPRPFLGRY